VLKRMTESFITVSTLAARWGVSGQSIRRKIRRGAIPAILTPGTRSIRIPARFVEEHERSFSRTSAPATTSVSTAI
jgi:excisionase family DNA binding protein